MLACKRVPWRKQRAPACARKFPKHCPRLANARRRHEDSNVLTPKSARCLLLHCCEPPFERDIQGLPFATLILDYILTVAVSTAGPVATGSP